MGGIFSSPAPPAPILAPTAPTVADPSVQQAATAQAAAQAQAAGRASTILTSGMGDTSAATVAKKQLLGQ